MPNCNVVQVLNAKPTTKAALECVCRGFDWQNYLSKFDKYEPEAELLDPAVYYFIRGLFNTAQELDCNGK